MASEFCLLFHMIFELVPGVKPPLQMFAIVWCTCTQVEHQPAARETEPGRSPKQDGGSEAGNSSRKGLAPMVFLLLMPFVCARSSCASSASTVPSPHM